MKPPSFDSLTIRALAAELDAALVGAQVQKVYQPDEHTIVLKAHKYPHNRRLLINVDPGMFRAHLTESDPRNPEGPPAFCMALRKFLEGSRILSVQQVGADRILILSISAALGSFQLVAEFLGRYANIVLVGEDDRIVEAIRHFGTPSAQRIILPNRPYPFVSDTRPSVWDAPDTVIDDVWNSLSKPPVSGEIQNAFSGMSPFLAGSILSADDPPGFLSSLRECVQQGRFSPVVLLDENNDPVGAWPIVPPGWPPDWIRHAKSMSRAIDEAFEHRSEAQKRDAITRRLLAAIDREARTLKARREDAHRHIAEGEKAEEWRVAGELLSVNAHSIPRGADSVSLANYYAEDSAPMTIALDPSLSVRENAEAYFRKARRAKASAERAPSDLQSISELEQALEIRRQAVESTDVATLIEMDAPAVTGGIGHTQPVRAFPPGVRIKRLTSPQGWPVWIGENAIGNDYLTTKASDPDDIWFHVRAAASAHAVIRTTRRSEHIPPETLRWAAEQVARRSEVKGSSVIPVDYTLRRYVRKPRNAVPGRVTYERERTIFVEPGGSK